MNFRALPGWKATGLTSVPDSTPHDIPARRLPVPVSRRQFARTAAGSALAAAVGSRLWTPSLVEAASFAPVPIPGGTPAPIVNKLNADVAQVVADPEFKQALAMRGFDAISSSPEQLAEFLDKDYVKFRDLIQRLGLQVE